MSHTPNGYVPPPGDLFKEWRTADSTAHALEQGHVRAAMAALNGFGEPPTETERQNARNLRTTADDLFHLAMAEMKFRSDSKGRHC